VDMAIAVFVGNAAARVDMLVVRFVVMAVIVVGVPVVVSVRRAVRMDVPMDVFGGPFAHGKRFVWCVPSCLRASTSDGVTPEVPRPPG